MIRRVSTSQREDANLEWTSDQVLKLAPDASAARSGRDLASVRRWAALGCNEEACWGECQGSGSSPYQTQIDLRGPAFRCSCPSRKFPCKHGLALFLLYAENQIAFAACEPPAWVLEWQAARAKKEEQRANKAETAREGEPAAPVDSAAQAKRLAQREAKVSAGLEELKRWLLDLVRQGLASAQARPYSFWESVAARMVDAQAPGLARAVSDLAGIPASGEGWPDRLLERLGRLLLLVEGYSRISDLPEPTQADLRSLVGWTQDQKELAGRPGVRDRWHVLGRRVEIEDRLKVQRNWLWGQTTGRAALVLSFAAGNQPLDVSLVPGTGIDAELVFFPSSWPLRALVKERHAFNRYHRGHDGRTVSPRSDERLWQRAGLQSLDRTGASLAGKRHSLVPGWPLAHPRRRGLPDTALTAPQSRLVAHGVLGGEPDRSFRRIRRRLASSLEPVERSGLSFAS